MMKSGDPRVYSVGQIAKVLHLARSTVVRWIHDGHLKTEKTQGGDNRIPRRNVEDFFADRGIPIELLDEALSRKIFVYDHDDELKGILEGTFSEFDNIRVMYAGNPFEAGYEIQEFNPHLIIMDVELRHSMQTNIIDFIKDKPDLECVKVIGTSFIPLSENQDISEWGFDAFMQKPVKPAELKAVVEELLPTFRKFTTKEI